MCFWRNKKINWPFWVFGLITLGIIVSVGFLIFNLLHKTTETNQAVSNVEFNLQVEKAKQEVLDNYKSSLNSLITVVESKEQIAEIKSEVQKIFLSIRVPADYLDVHLQAWLKIDSLNETNFKVEVINILKDLQSKVN